MTDADILQSDLRELLSVVGMRDHARPQSPHEVFQEALGVLRERLSTAKDLRTALGNPFLAGHSGCEEGPHVKLIYETVGEAMDAHEALTKLLRSDAEAEKRSQALNE